MDMVKNCLGISTALTPYIGYDKAAEIVKEALEKDKSVYDLALERGLLSRKQLDKLLSPERMVKPRRVYRRVQIIE